MKKILFILIMMLAGCTTNKDIENAYFECSAHCNVSNRSMAQQDCCLRGCLIMVRVLEHKSVVNPPIIYECR